MTETETRLAAVVEELRALDTEAGDAALSAESQKKWDALESERSALASQIAAVNERRATLARNSVLPAYTVRGTQDPLGEPDGVQTRNTPHDLDAVYRALNSESPTRGGNELRSRAMKATEQLRGVNDASKEKISGLIESMDLEGDDEGARAQRKVAAHIVATSSPEYMRAWSKAFRTVARNGVADQDSVGVLQRAMSLTTTAGGFAVPLPVDPTLILNDDGSVNPFRRLATQRTITTSALRTVNSTAPVFSWDGEAAEVSDDTTTFANIDITAHKAQGAIPFSIEIEGDYPGFTQDIQMLLSRGRDNLEATAFATGTGTGQPFGIVTALTGTASEVAETTASTFTAADVYNLEAQLPDEYRQRASWVAHKRIYQSIRQFGGTSLGEFWANLGQGQPPRLVGYPTYESSAMDGTITAASNNYVLIFGDFSNYWIVDRVGFSMELVPHMLATANNRPNGTRAFYCYWRVGADSVNDRGFRMLNVSAA